MAYEKMVQEASKITYQSLQLKRDALARCNRTYDSNIAREDAKWESFKEREKQRHALALEKAEQLYKQGVARERAAVTASEQALEVTTKEYERRLIEKDAAREARKAALAEYKQLEALQQQAEASVIEQYAVLGESTLLTCGAGLEVQSVVAGFDTCRITIKNLPREVKHCDVSEIFTQQGMIHSDFLVLNLRSKEDHQEATVLAVADRGRAMAIGLDGIEFRNRNLTFKASENANNACALTISWRVPSAAMIASYNSMEEATKKVTDLNGKTCKGQEIKVEMNQLPPTAVLKFYVPSSIKLIGFPLGVCIDQEIYDFTGTSNIKPLKSCSLQDTFDCLLQHLKAFPNVKMNSDQLPKPINGRVVVKIQFENREDAKKAFELFDKKKLLPRSPTFVAYLENLVRHKIVIPQQQYKAQEREWNLLSEKRSGSDAYVQIRHGDRDDVYIIQVVGQDKKMVGSLEVRVRNMIAGDKLDPSFWHSSVTPLSAGVKSFFDRIFTEKKVHVRSDFKAKALKIYGEADAKAEARQMIKEEVDRLAQLETTLTLDQASVGFFMRRGLARLKDLVGEDKVVHSLESGRCMITIKGPDENRYHLYRLVEESRTGLIFPEQHLKGRTQPPSPICPICTDEISHSERLGCGHNYCPECLRHYLTSAPETKLFPLACITCKVPIPIPLLRRLLTPQAFQALVETAFSSYLSDPARKLKYCRTADCEQVYLQSEDPKVLNCPVCFSTVCSACGEEAHSGMTCAESKLSRDPAEQDRLFDSWVAANNARRCPGCSTPIEKIDGCNHITCNRCQTHFCWKCGFSGASGKIYPHLNEVHGGFFDY